MARPLKYKPEYCDELIQEMASGKLDVEIYSKWDVCKDTFYTWIKEYPEFSEAVQLGRAKCESWWIGKIRECWLNKDEKGFKYCISLMNNKFGWGKDENLKGNTTNIQINQMNMLSGKTEVELLEILQSKLQRIQGSNNSAKLLEGSLIENHKEI